MKFALLLLASVALSPVMPKAHSADISWNEIHAFIATEATNYDSATESSLCMESVFGEKTWEISGDVVAHHVDGYGLGWPREGEVITFATPEQALHLGEMIDEFRESQAH